MVLFQTLFQNKPLAENKPIHSPSFDCVLGPSLFLSGPQIPHLYGERVSPSSLDYVLHSSKCTEFFMVSPALAASHETDGIGINVCMM